MPLKYSDVIMAFAALVAYAGIAPWIYRSVDMLQEVADPLTAVIVGAFPALIIIAMILSTGVASRS
jgi:tellurite resistance protein TehA-like permease